MCKKSIYPISLVLVLGLLSSASADLVAHWQFNNNGTDSVGTLNWTLNGGAGYSTDAIEGSHSLMLDGTNDYASQAAVGTLIDEFSTKTVMIWFKANTTNGTQVLYDEGGTTRGLSIRINNGNLETAVRDASTQVTASTSFRSTDWSHVGATFDNGLFMLYLNGKEVDSITAGFTSATAHSNAAGIGARNGQDSFGGTGTGDYFGGLIDDVRVYDNALSVDEIRKFGGIALSKADEPSPADGQTDLVRNVVLGWKPGEFANTHDVYFGTSFDDVNNATNLDPMGPDKVYRARQGLNSYAVPERLDFGQTYYWRIDEVNAPPTSHVVFKGDVWSFTVEPVAYPIAGENITATASSANQAGMGPEKTIDGSGLDANDLHSREAMDMWLSGSEPLGAWIEYEFDKIYKLHELWVWNSNQAIEPLVGFGLKDVTIEYSTNGTDYATLGTTHEFVRALGTGYSAHDTTVDFSGAAAKHVRLTANSNWGGMPQYSLSEVRFFYTPIRAREPSPDSGATDVDVDVVLSFRAGREAAQHNVYLSTDEQAVADSTAPVTTVTETSYGPLSLDLAQTYYWKINEVNMAETPTMLEGDIWNFTTRQFLVVDDFESYNDLDPGDAESNRVYLTWIDGYEQPTNGSQVGYTKPPFCEQTIVHGGGQSMPLFYDNSVTARYSEAELTLRPAQDWIKHAVNALSLWFSGDPNNVPDQMYVKVNGSKVTYDGAADNLTLKPWQPWNIDLASLGIDLQNVTKLSIGFGDETDTMLGGSGVVFFDDIRLYPYSRQFVTPADPNAAGLVARYEFEGNTNDISGNGLHGTVMGNPTFVAGKVGQAISLDGFNDYVEITGYKGILGPNAVTVTAWINTTNTGTGATSNAIVGWGPNVDGQRFGFRIDDSRLRTEHAGGNVQGDSYVADGRWHHVAVTVQENATVSYPEVILYLDGYDDTRPSTDPDPYNITAALDVSIGRRPASNDRYFIGLLDDVRIYDRALTAEEIAWLAGRTEPFDKPF